MKSKCKICKNYEGREKEVGKRKLEISSDIEVPIFHFWKWCKLKNNWCKNVAGSCGAVVKGYKNKSALESEENVVDNS